MRIQIPDEQPKVFSLSTPMHLLYKLRWEIAGFQRSLRSKSLYREPAYHAFNCAVTAWHMTDWIWGYVGRESQAELASTYALKRADLRSFQDAMAKSSRAVNACQEIANGSKHREVMRKRADPHVRALVDWGEVKPSAKHPEGIGVRWQITDARGTRPALEVFIEAAEYWQRFLAPWREDSYVSGQPTRRTQR